MVVNCVLPIGCFWGAIVAGLVALGSAISATVVNKRTANRTMAHQERLANQAYQHDMNMWNMANEYNTPAAQRERMELAGYNPNLFYSQGNVGNAAQSMPQFHPPKPDLRYGFNLDALSHLSAFNDVQLKDAQTDNVKANNRLIEQEIANRAIDVEIKGADLAKKNFDYDLAKELRQNSIDMAIANLKKVNAETLNIGVDRRMKTYMLYNTLPNQNKKLLQETEQLKYMNELRQYGIMPGDSAFTRWLYMVGLPYIKKKFKLGDGPLVDELYYLNYPQNRD